MNHATRTLLVQEAAKKLRKLGMYECNSDNRLPDERKQALKVIEEYRNMGVEVVNILQIKFDQQRKKKKPASKHIGVSKCAGKWRAEYYKDGKRMYIGSYNTEKEAVKAINNYKLNLK